VIDVIQQNPFIILLIALVPLVAGIWKVMDMLFVKPRDFRISVLEKNVEEIRKEIQKGQIQPPAVEQKAVSTESDSAIITSNEEPEKIEKIIETTTLLNDMCLFYESWKDKQLTELQRNQFEKNYIEQKVVWIAKFSSVSEERDGYLWVSLTASDEGFYGVHVIAVFDANHKEALLMINKGELVTVSGTIHSFSLSPIIRKCNLTRKT
jgi:hypothetical protein